MPLNPTAALPARLFILTVGVGLAMLANGVVQAGVGFGRQQAVGGVMIAPDGGVRAATEAERRELAAVVRQRIGGEMGQADGAEGGDSERRYVSLAKLQSAIELADADGTPLPPEVIYLAGLTRIEFVIVDDAAGDLILAGPAEAWRIGDDGTVVGQISGDATLRLADLRTAMQSIQQARQEGGMRCSIEPTEQGRIRLQQLLANVKLQPGQNPQYLAPAMQQAFGPQEIKLGGVDPTSHLARTMVAADFEMKRIAMGLIASPVPRLPSYIEMAKNRVQPKNQNPRWWMACNYDPVAHDEDFKVWKLSGQGVKTLTEQDFVDDAGQVRRDGSKNPQAEAWANAMTELYPELSREMPIFADLRNAMDMAVIATLISQQGLEAAAGLDLSTLRGSVDGEYEIPRTLQPQCSFVKGRAGWVVTASGGVDISSFEVVADQVLDASLASIAKPAGDGAGWYWD